MKQNLTKTKAGGKREGSGAKLKYGEETKMVSFRVPKSKIPELSKLVSSFLKSLAI